MSWYVNKQMRQNSSSESNTCRRGYAGLGTLLIQLRACPNTCSTDTKQHNSCRRVLLGRQLFQTVWWTAEGALLPSHYQSINLNLYSVTLQRKASQIFLQLETEPTTSQEQSRKDSGQENHPVERNFSRSRL